MSIKFAILGFLSYKPMTGYDLKRVIQESPFMHWSGNNNQIYKTLQELLDEQYVTSEVHLQAHAPSKKVYTITEKGVEALKNWVVSRAEMPEIKKTFLVQLAWADMIDEDEIERILLFYEELIDRQMRADKQNLSGENGFLPERTPREKRIWELIYENVMQIYESELEWVKKVKEEIKKQEVGANDPIEADEIKTEVADRSESGEEEITALAIIEQEQTAIDKKKIELIINEEVNTELAERELQRLLDHSIKVATAFEEQESLQTRFKEVLTGFDKGVGLKPGETIETI